MKNQKTAFSKILCVLSIVLFAFGSCKKANNFDKELSALPQVDQTTTYAYKSAYIIGDTMVITGRLQPKNNLQISVGGITAQIVKTDTVVYYPSNNKPTNMDQVSILISAQMAGKARAVKITTGGYSTLGPDIDVYTYGGAGSFTDSLKAVQVATSSPQNVFFYCINGKGDVYYYAAATKDLRHLKKDGTEEVLFDLSKPVIPGGSSITACLAGGVDPTNTSLYFSVHTTTDYEFFKLNLLNKQLTTLNRSDTLSAPYEGPIGAVKMIVTGVFPDSKGNLYLSLGLGVSNYSNSFLPDAIARYNAVDGTITYAYKGPQGGNSNVFPNMPGKSFANANGLVASLRFSPDEDLMYVLERGFNNAGIIEVYYLPDHVKLQTFTTSNTTGSKTQFDVIAPFNGLHINISDGTNPDQAFGYLPMPGRRLQILLFQVIAGSVLNNPAPNVANQLGFARWVVFDFAAQRTYAYALGRFNQGNDVFQPTGALSPQFPDIDELLNYDEQGSLYMTTNGKRAVIRTHTIN